MIRWENIQPDAPKIVDVRERLIREFHKEVGEAYSAGFFDCKRMCKAEELCTEAMKPALEDSSDD